MIVSVVGKGRNCTEEVERTAWAVGQVVAGAGHVVVTGGLGGAMEAAQRGAIEAHGPTVALLPEQRDTPGPSNLALKLGVSEHVRNVILANVCDAMVAVDGSHGTLQELAVALDREVPVCAVGTDRWEPCGVESVGLGRLAGWLEEAARVS